jgi:hypothetical protein
MWMSEPTQEQLERLGKLAHYQAEVYLLKGDAEALCALLETYKVLREKVSDWALARYMDDLLGKGDHSYAELERQCNELALWVEEGKHE